MSSFEEKPTEEEQECFQAFRKAVDERDEYTINLLIRKEGILQKNFVVDERTFLHVVAQRGTIGTAIEICKLQSNVNIEGKNKETPIYNAIKHSAEMVSILIKNGADVNLRNKKGETPLHHAIKHSAEIVKILLQNGAKVNIKGEKKVTLLHEALLSGTEEIVRLILNKILSKIRSDYEEVEKAEEIVTVLFRNKEFLKIVEKDYPLLILFVAKIGDSDIFKLMLNKIRESLNMMRQPSRSSVWRRCCDRERKYWTRISDVVNLPGYYNRTALHYAIREQLPEVVRYLLKAGADANCRTTKYFTPLHYATSLQNEEICKTLLSFEANINFIALSLGSPIYQVCLNSSIRKSLESRNGYYYLEKIYDGRPMAQGFNPKITQLLIKSGANLNLPGDNGKPLLLEACLTGSLEPLKFLFQFGADLGILDINYNSALHYAVLGNSLEIVDFLLEKGLDIDVRNDEDCTPLFLLTQRRPELMEMTEYLVDRGADINASNDGMMTALHFSSIVFESMESVEGLLELGASWKLKDKIDLPRNMRLQNFGGGRKTLISFIALHEEKLENCINYYFEHEMRELPKALKYFEMSRLEVEKLKLKKVVEGTAVSFYDFLTGSVYNTVQIAKNEEIKKVFKSLEYIDEFTCYWFLLLKRYERIIALTEAVDRMTYFLYNCLSPLPTLFICKLLNTLSSSDFRKFDRNLSRSKRVVEEELNPNLIFNKVYTSEIAEIRETGVMVSLYPNMPPALLPNSQLKIGSVEKEEWTNVPLALLQNSLLNTLSVPHPDVLNLKFGEKIRVKYKGKYPETGRVRLTAKFISK